MIVDVVGPKRRPIVTRYLQAFRMDTLQATKVRLAIRLGVPVADISDHRARIEVTERLLRAREEVQQWQ